MKKILFKINSIFLCIVLFFTFTFKPVKTEAVIAESIAAYSIGSVLWTLLFSLGVTYTAIDLAHDPLFDHNLTLEEQEKLNSMDIDKLLEEYATNGSSAYARDVAKPVITSYINNSSGNNNNDDKENRRKAISRVVAGASAGGFLAYNVLAPLSYIGKNEETDNVDFVKDSISEWLQPMLTCRGITASCYEKYKDFFLNCEEKLNLSSYLNNSDYYVHFYTWNGYKTLRAYNKNIFYTYFDNENFYLYLYCFSSSLPTKEYVSENGINSNLIIAFTYDPSQKDYYIDRFTPYDSTHLYRIDFGNYFTYYSPSSKVFACNPLKNQYYCDTNLLESPDSDVKEFIVPYTYIDGKPIRTTEDLGHIGINIDEGKVLEVPTNDELQEFCSDYETAVQNGYSDTELKTIHDEFVQAHTKIDPDSNTDSDNKTDTDTDTNTNPDAGTNTNPDVGTNTNPDAGTNTNPDTDNESENNSNNNASLDNFVASGVDGLKERFPFCIPFDLIEAFKCFEAEPESPRWVIPFKVKSLNIDEEIVIDLKMFDPLAELCRYLMLLFFIVVLILGTRKLIKN